MTHFRVENQRWTDPRSYRCLPSGGVHSDSHPAQRCLLFRRATTWFSGSKHVVVRIQRGREPLCISPSEIMIDESRDPAIYDITFVLLLERALITDTKVECDTPPSKSGTSVHFDNGGFLNAFHNGGRRARQTQRIPPARAEGGQGGFHCQFPRQ